jgi:hypothetical protein
MVQPQGMERVFFQDETGSYYVQTAGMTEPVQVPAANSAEVEEVIRGQDDTAGFIAIGALGLTPQAGTLQHGGHQLSTLGKCNGECGRSFGVLGPQTR